MTRPHISRHCKAMLRRAFYRAADIICAAAGLLLLSPLFLVVTLVVLAGDGLPVFFSQDRLGRGGKRFRIWKFRTMRPGTGGPFITGAGDSRITSVGSALRRRKFDELPQLFNVLRGDMSFIGPRPEVPEWVQLANPTWQLLLQVRPGITDLATIVYRDEEEILGAAQDPDTLYRDRILPAKLVLNLKWLRSRSLCGDLKLIYLTVRYGVFPTGFDPDLIQHRLLQEA